MDDAPGERAPPAGAFEGLVARVEPGLRRGLVAAYGPDLGRDAALDALVWAWRHWDRVVSMANPGGYLYRVGQSSARRDLRRRDRHRATPTAMWSDHLDEHEVEPGLARALSVLSPRQRAAVMLVHGYRYTLTEAALAMGCSSSAVRNHVDRALKRLRAALGAFDG